MKSINPMDRLFAVQKLNILLQSFMTSNVEKDFDRIDRRLIDGMYNSSKTEGDLLQRDAGDLVKNNSI